MARSLLPVAVALWFLGACPAARSAPSDVSDRFLQALQQRGHDRLALEYLERAASDPLVDEAFRLRVPAELAATQLRMTRAIADPAERLASIRDAAAAVEALKGDGEAARRVRTDLADLRGTTAAAVARADAIAARARDEGVARSRALESARRKLKAAETNLEAAEAAIAAERATLKGVSADTPEGARRKDLGARLALVRLLAGRLLHERAETHEPDDRARDRLNREAAEKLAALYEKYAKWAVGLYAHLYEGRCYRLLGERALAVATLDDLITQPAPTPELRRIVTLAHAEAVALAVETRRGGEKREDDSRAIARAEEWINALPRGETGTTEGATLAYWLGEAALGAAAADDRTALRSARDRFTVAARAAGEWRDEARDRLAEVNRLLGDSTRPPESFSEGLEAGLATVAELAATEDASVKAEARDRATRQLMAALALVDSETPADQVSQARYLLGYLDWERGDDTRAAVRATFVARTAADSPSGEDAARLALAAWDRIARSAGGSLAAAASGRLSEFAAFVIKEWPEGPASEAAASVLLSRALESNDLQAAEELLASVPESRRAALRLRLAIARWERLGAKPGADGGAEALAALRSAVDAAPKNAPLRGAGSLYLAMVALAGGDTGEASKRLADADLPAETPVPLKLARERVAIRVAAARSEEAMTDRYAELAAGAEASRPWLTLASELSGDLDRGVSAAAEPLAVALAKLGEVEAAGDWNTRLWIAQTRLRCGEAVADPGASKALLEAGRAALGGLVERAESEPGFAPSPTSVIAARLRLAECQSALGEHKAAFESLAEVLASGVAVVEAQRAAANALVAWGKATEDATKLEQAIAGARPDDRGKNTVWGYSRLASILGRGAAGDPRRLQLFFEAWRSVAQTRYEAALLADGDLRKEQLRKAANTVRALARQHPELGGDASRAAFDTLLKQIQSSLGQRPDGLDG